MGAPDTSPQPYEIVPVEHLGDPAWAIKCADGDLIAVGCLRRDALQFAAAPDLYDALNELENALLDGLCNYGLPDFDTNRMERARIQARAVLTKARGESC